MPWMAALAARSAKRHLLTLSRLVMQLLRFQIEASPVYVYWIGALCLGFAVHDGMSRIYSYIYFQTLLILTSVSRSQFYHSSFFFLSNFSNWPCFWVQIKYSIFWLCVFLRLRNICAASIQRKSSSVRTVKRPSADQTNYDYTCYATLTAKTSCAQHVANSLR